MKDILLKGLDSIDNPLESAGVDVSELGVGSLEGPICSVILGGEMTEDPETTEETTTETTTTATSAENEGGDTENDDAEGDDTEGASSTVPTSTSAESN